jgi:hypothetical protein
MECKATLWHLSVVSKGMRNVVSVIKERTWTGGFLEQGAE